jgi:hypothetical protein
MYCSPFVKLGLSWNYEECVLYCSPFVKADLSWNPEIIIIMATINI